MYIKQKKMAAAANSRLLLSFLRMSFSQLVVVVIGFLWCCSSVGAYERDSFAIFMPDVRPMKVKYNDVRHIVVESLKKAIL
jgi:hypothetical protein